MFGHRRGGDQEGMVKEGNGAEEELIKKRR